MLIIIIQYMYWCTSYIPPQLHINWQWLIILIPNNIECYPVPGIQLDITYNMKFKNINFINFLRMLKQKWNILRSAESDRVLQVYAPPLLIGTTSVALARSLWHSMFGGFCGRVGRTRLWLRWCIRAGGCDDTGWYAPLSLKMGSLRLCSSLPLVATYSCGWNIIEICDCLRWSDLKWIWSSCPGICW